MRTEATLSTVISADVKRAITAYCKRRGLKMRHVVEEALAERLEDEIDLEAYRARRDEGTISLEEVVAARRKTRK